MSKTVRVVRARQTRGRDGTRGTAISTTSIGPESEFLSDLLLTPGDFGEMEHGRIVRKLPRETSSGYRKQ